MSNKESLATIWDELHAVRCKQQYLNEVDMVMNEQLLDKAIELHKDTVYGKAKLGMELETEFENIMSKFEELL